AYLLSRDAKAREIFLKSGAGKRYIREQLIHYLSAVGSVLAERSCGNVQFREHNLDFPGGGLIDATVRDPGRGHALPPLHEEGCSMPEFTITRQVGAPVETVWEVLNDFGNTGVPVTATSLRLGASTNASSGTSRMRG
ncbi:MAG: hypothetical protein JRJ24_20660, partial [Deltaproteobacteria bacterium]|nr:hypothetical protein [Deltaproteobacteria bacterium]